MSEKDVAPTPRRSAAGIVASGIFASRVIGFVRERAVAYFFGVSAYADVLGVALRAPNLLQNLLGEGTLSAAFIPIYSRMIAEGRAHEAGRFAGAIFGLLLAVAALLALLGALLAPYIVAVLVPGFVLDARGELPFLVAWIQEAATALLERFAFDLPDPSPVDRYALTVPAVRIVFPMAGVLVLSAWALGVLNSHRRFFLPYFAPVLLNVAFIAGLFVAATLFIEEPLDVEHLASLSASTRTQLLFAALVGALVGGFLQFGVQLPLVFRVMRGFEFSLSTRVAGVREAIRAFGPVVAGRGVAQLSGYIDFFLAAFLAAGAIAAMRPALMLYLLPVSLFGLSVAASELPELARMGSQQALLFGRRLDRSLRQMLFLTIPAVIGYLGFGFLIVGALFRNGSFGINANWLVYLVLCGYALGLLATTMSRLMQNAFYALGDTKTPAKIAVVRVAVSTVIAIPLMFGLDRIALARLVDLPPQEQPLFLGAVGLALGASAGAWTELWRLHASLRGRLGAFRLPWLELFKMGGLATLAAAPAAALWWVLPPWHVALAALVVVGAYGIVYLVAAQLLRMEEAEAWTGQFLSRFRKV